MLAGVAVFVGGGILLALPRGPLARTWEQRKSGRNLDHIATALCAYSRRHQGALPPRLSHLFPDYIDDHALFFVADTDHADPSLPKLDLEAPQAIDLHSPYTVMASITGDRAMVFERTGLWKDSTIGWRKISRDGAGSAFAQGGSGRSAAGDFAAILNDYLAVAIEEQYRAPHEPPSPPTAQPSRTPAP